MATQQEQHLAEILKALLEHNSLSPWEQDFAANVIEQVESNNQLTEVQIDKCEQIIRES